MFQPWGLMQLRKAREMTKWHPVLKIRQISIFGIRIKQPAAPATAARGLDLMRRERGAEHWIGNPNFNSNFVFFIFFLYIIGEGLRVLETIHLES